MSARVFLGLLVITVIAVAAAAIVAFERPTAAPVRYVDQPAFPALRADPDAVAKVVLTTPEGSFTLVRETGDRWAALERFGYPVDSDKVRALVVALADMRLIEAKTRLPERYARLEVEDPDAEDARSRMLRVESADGKVLAEAILGKRQHRLTGNQAAGTYLRRPGEEQSWLASGGADIATDVVDWLDEEIVDLDPGRIGRIALRPESGAGYVVRRDGAGEPLELADLEADERVREDADLERLAGAFAQMRLEGVKPRAELAWPEEHHSATATSFDGVELTIQLARIDGEPWALLSARAVEPLAAPAASAAPEAAATAEAAASAEAATDDGAGEGVEEVAIVDGSAPPPDPAALAARLQPWAFKISSQLFDWLTTPRSEWLTDSGTS
jgi:hypothetical protein